MDKCYLDANILIYFKNEDSPFFQKALRTLTHLVQNDSILCVSPLVIDEFLHGLKVHLLNQRVAQHTVFSLLSSSLRDILDLPSLTIINPPTASSEQQKVISYMKECKLKPRDAYHLLTMRTHGVGKFATFDKDFKIVFSKKIITPAVD